MEHQATEHITVPAFAVQPDGEQAIIAHPDRGVFVRIPAEGLLILDRLAEGMAVAEVRRLEEQRTGSSAGEFDDFLAALSAEGFVLFELPGPGRAGGPPAPPGPGGPGPHAGPGRGWPSRSVAARLVSAPVLLGALCLVAAAVALICADPAVIPGPSALVFPHYLWAFCLGACPVVLAGLALHELGHLVAARAAGVPARIGVGRRLWWVVAETDMSSIWLAPRRQRYIAILAGPLIDAVSAAVLIDLLWLYRHGRLEMPTLAAQALGALLMIYLLRLLWQGFLFMRTDLYYVLATATGCANLHGDTEAFVHNLFRRARRAPALVDQSGILAAEMRVIRAYSAAWVFGRAAAGWMLFTVTLPVMWGYFTRLGPLLVGGRSRYGVADGLTLICLPIALEVTGLVWWLRSHFGHRKEIRSDEH